MADDVKKKILIVDDSDLDREILKVILEGMCDIEEATDAFEALENVCSPDSDIDGIMLDVQMPGLDGFGFLRIARLLNINIPIVLITAEATRENVAKAAQSGVISFISKPFHRESVQARMNSVLKNMVPGAGGGAGASARGNAGGGGSSAASDEDELADLVKTLEDIMKSYFKARKMNDKRYKNVEAVAEVLFGELIRKGKAEGITEEDIPYLAKAAYFCDLGLMIIPDEQAYAEEPLKVGGWQEKMVYKNHTTVGAQIVSLSTSPACSKFVEACADMCQNHHERVDGKGYPRSIGPSDFSLNAQVCGMAYDLVVLVEKKQAEGGSVEDAIAEMERTSGNYGLEVFDALGSCHSRIVAAFR